MTNRRQRRKCSLQQKVRAKLVNLSCYAITIVTSHYYAIFDDANKKQNCLHVISFEAFRPPIACVVFLAVSFSCTLKNKRHLEPTVAEVVSLAPFVAASRCNELHTNIENLSCYTCNTQANTVITGITMNSRGSTTVKGTSVPSTNTKVVGSGT